MQLNRLLVAVVFISLSFSSLLANITNAEDPIENRVDATIDIEFLTGTEFKVNIDMDVSKLTLAASGTAYTKNEIKTIAGTSPETMGAIKYALKALLTGQIKQTFEDAYVTAINELPSYENDIFHDEYKVNLTPTFFNMNETVNIPNFINGALDIGAFVNYTFNLKAETGWNNTYIIILPDPMGYQRTTGSVSGNRIQWDVKNGDGEHPDLPAEISIRLDEPTTSGLETENIELDFGINCSGKKQTVLTTNVLVKSTDIRDYDILPEFVTNLKVAPSDGMRLFIENGLSSWEELYDKTIKTVKEIALSKIENSTFNQTLDVSFDWDPTTAVNCSTPYNITNMDNNPPVKAIFTDEDVNFQMCGVTSRALLGLVSAGAQTNISAEDVNFGDRLDEIGHPYTISLYLPNGLYLDGKNIYVWNQSVPISGEFESDDAPSYSEESIDTLVEIEVSSTDLNILSFFTGGTKLTLNLFLQEKQSRSITLLDNNLNLPEKVSLEYLNSDAFRLCIEENVFDESSVDAFLNAEKQLFEDRATTILSGLDIEGSVNRGEFDDSLKWDGNITDMDGISPVEIVSYAHCPYSMPFEFSFILPNFEIPNQNFNFTGLQNQNVTYKIIFPHGTTIEVNDSLNKATINKTEDGRYYLELSFSASESGLTDVVSCKIVPSMLFIVGLFMPCIVSLIITIILVMVIYTIRRKRRGGGKTTVKDEKVPNSIEEQEYYVPPSR
ncbi:MAG: hypothetical protein U9R21_09870 [Candidatus Thermoplasmatota archaeon]|nr:hypothetical protein [Candidatus Thermoplasmatota archaeon]